MARTAQLSADKNVRKTMRKRNVEDTVIPRSNKKQEREQIQNTFFNLTVMAIIPFFAVLINIL